MNTTLPSPWPATELPYLRTLPAEVRKMTICFTLTFRVHDGNDKHQARRTASRTIAFLTR
jgi:hypothetical protein